ncbi:hypothetical protein LV469_01235 [Peptoniphilus sp. GNH]|nr:hypothetical protein LV469_01235 [Peptoniphilus sp. GNH]
MFKVLRIFWYSPFLSDSNRIAIVKTENNGEIRYHIGTVEGNSREEQIQHIINYGDYFYPEDFR